VYWDKDLPVNGGEYENKPFYRTWAGNYAIFYLNFIPRVDIVKDEPLEITISKITNAACVISIRNSKDEKFSDEKTLPNVDLLQNYTIKFNLTETLKANEIYRLRVIPLDFTNIYYPITTNYDVESNAYMNILNDRIETGINDVLGNEFKSIQTAVGELTTYKNESTEQFAEFKQGLEEFKSTIGTQGEQISEISQKADEIALKV
jgi:sporulation-control protein spo0M